jgi:Zn finger protein HypA/HybF involved in hydrogenase expression
MADKYLCNDCGGVYTEEELDCELHYEDRGEFWGSPCREKVYVYTCPDCGSEEIEIYDETEDYLDEDEY